ncbi:ATP-binding protein [Paraburkholderia sp. D1E]|uniref:ATP-binding protein n=1 Tax=Paraburkholderia sp. D1E TaxID=3461398 RepID=UPI0040460FFA
MNSDQFFRLRYLVLLWIFGCAALGLVTWISFRLGFSLASAGFAFLIVIVLLSLLESFVSSVIFSVFSAACLNYYFTEPIFSFSVASPQDLMGLATFAITSLIITALVRHTRHLGDARREQARLLDLTHDPVFVRDMNDVISYWNRGAEELYGWKKTEAIGKISPQLLQTRFPVPLNEITDTLLRTGRWEGELVRTRRDGQQVVVASRLSLQKSENGRSLAKLETNNDITERRRAEDALRRSQAEYLAEAQRLSLTGSFGWNVISGEVFWSDQSFRIFEYDPAIPPTIKGVLKRTHPDDVALVQRVVKQSIDARQDFDFKNRLLMPDGSIKHLHVVAHAVKEDASKLQYYGAIKDITATRLAEEQLHESQVELAHVARVTALGELSASIAHEVSQPLAAIVTNGDACLRWLDHATPRPEEVQACVQRMIADGRRASEIVRRIRALTKRDTPEKTCLDLNDVVNDVALLVQHEIFTRRVSMRLELAPALPPLLAGRVELQQVILNLVLNGIQAMDGISDGPRELLIRTRQDEVGDLVLAVQDSGTGIKPERFGQLFDPFFTTKPDGMGMGLSICRSIIEAHGGRVCAFNHIRRGAVVQFSVPPSA